MVLVEGMRWGRAILLAALIAAAATAWLGITMPRTPTSSFIGRSADAIVQANEREALLRFTARLRGLAGSNAKDCGAFALSNTDKSVVACGADSLSREAPFWLAIELQSERSTEWVGLVQDAQGGTYRLEFGSGSLRGLRHVSPTRCRQLSITPAADERGKLFSCPTVAVP